MAHWEVRERGPWRQVRGLAWEELPLPLAALVAGLVGTLRVQGMVRACRGSRCGCAPEGGRA